jgi:hypothetical protein
MKPFPGEVRKDYTIKCHPYALTDDQVEWLSETFPVTENIAIVRAMGISYPTLYKMARRYGLSKTEEGLQAIRQRQTEWHKRMNRQTRLHLMSGQQTGRCMNVRIKPYTKLQVDCRSKAVRIYGYIVTEGHQARDHDPDRYVIYYDDKTRRSAKFEANCEAAGFNIKEL